VSGSWDELEIGMQVGGIGLCLKYMLAESSWISNKTLQFAGFFRLTKKARFAIL
jgi:hypothetical protein